MALSPDLSERSVSSFKGKALRWGISGAIACSLVGLGHAMLKEREEAAEGWKEVLRVQQAMERNNHIILAANEGLVLEATDCKRVEELVGAEVMRRYVFACDLEVFKPNLPVEKQMLPGEAVSVTF